MILPLIRATCLTNPRQRIADEHVYHAGATELRVHYDHPRRLLAHLADDSCFFLSFEYVRGFEGYRHHGFYETFRSSLSAIQTLIID